MKRAGEPRRRRGDEGRWRLGGLAMLALAPLLLAGIWRKDGDAGGGSGSRQLVRIATYNIRELDRKKVEAVDPAGRGADPQLRAAAEVLQRIRPDILLVNEIDYDPEGEVARRFAERYLGVSQRGLAPLDLSDIFTAPVNTGEASGFDLDHDGSSDGPADAWGFGRYPGQYGLALYSRFSVRREAVRTFRLLRWAAMPGNLMPDGTAGKPAWYPPAVAARLRLSSKSHWDVPVEVDGRALHLLVSHPTPSVFDGAEDRNGRRNFDEIRLWADYLSGGETARYVVDDAGRAGGLAPGASFVVLGDLNVDPERGDRAYGSVAIDLLLRHPRVLDPAPVGAGGPHLAGDWSGKRHWTSPWGRLDYVLPSRDLEVVDAAVFWPAPEDPLAALAAAASDHRAVWVDLVLPLPG